MNLEDVLCQIQTDAGNVHPASSSCRDEKDLNAWRLLGFREGVTRWVSRRRLGKAQRAQHGDGLLGTLRFAQPTLLR
ncbi:MAG: hypothetical protein Q8O33_06490, partial [Pseudomonadota bacterium]|nr:hypothetical protein [Pseudomonadota bacterium]